MIFRLFLWVLTACSVPLAAQWLHYPTAGVPRTADGKPNLAAPTARLADGKPDLSGMWLVGDPSPCPKLLQSSDGDCAEKTALSKKTGNIADGLTGGLPYQKWARDLAEQRKADHGKDDPHARCLPANYPRAYTLPHIKRFLQVPGMVVILDEFNASYRQIYLDGRALPVDPQPSWNGYSTAKWAGDTLVVTSAGFRDDLWLDTGGDPLTSAAKITERITRPDFGHLNIEVTVDDPKAYTKPWTVTLNDVIVLDTEMVDEICLENERSVQHMSAK